MLLYYTNVVGLAAGSIATMFLLIRFWDAVADLVAGRLVDAKKPGRWGKFRPFVIWFALPLLLSNFVMFSANIIFPGMSQTQALVYAYITYALMGTLYSLVNIPYGSMAPAMTQRPKERAKLAAWRMYGANVTILMLSFVVAPQIKKYATDTPKLQTSLFITVAIFVALGLALYAWFVRNCKEQVYREIDSPSLLQSFKTAGKNKPLIILCVSSLMFLTGMIALGTLSAYYAMYVLGDANYIMWNTLAQTAATFLIASQIPRFVGSIGKRNAYLFLSMFTVAGGAVLAFMPPSVPLISVFGFFLLGVGIGGVNTVMWALEADTVEYGEWKTGVRTEGTSYALFSFTRKMGQALGGAVAGYGLALAAFNSAAAKAGEKPSLDTVHGIQLWTGGLVAGFSIIAVLIMVFYPLTDAKFAEIVEHIKQRREVQPV